MADSNNTGDCRECRGTGRVMLLTSTVSCVACGGTGRAAAAGAPAPPATAGAYALGSAAPAAAHVTCETQYDDHGRAVCVTRMAYDEKDRLVWQSVEYFADEAGEGDGCEPEAAGSSVLVRYTYYAEDGESDEKPKP